MRPLERTTVNFAPTISCASCEWTELAGHPQAHRRAMRHAETHPGHLAVVETLRSRQYIVREADAS